MNFGLSSQLEGVVGVEELGVIGFSNCLSIGNETIDPGFSFDLPAMVGDLGEKVEEAVGTNTGCFGSNLEVDTLCPRSKPDSESSMDDDRAGTGGPASSGVLKAFSHEPARGSVDDRPGCANGDIGPACVFSILSSAT